MHIKWTIWSFVSATLLIACSDGESDGATCAGANCGGDLVGTWHADSACLNGDLSALAPKPANLPQQCSDLVGKGTLGDVDITTTYGADLTYSVMGTIEVNMSFHLSSACYSAQAGTTVQLTMAICDQFATTVKGMLEGSPTVTCTLLGAACECQVSMPTPIAEQGTYSLMGNQVKHSEVEEPQDYCVTGDELKLDTGTDNLPAVFTAKRMK